MTVYVDDFLVRADVVNGPRTVRGVWSHMMADTHEELEAMARQLGLKPTWIQHEGTAEEHYDVTKSVREAALRRGAVELPCRSPGWMAFRARKRAIARGVAEEQLPPGPVVEIQVAPTLF